jgi:pimeloyl-ACP methyl ester carboxylesterase
MIYLSIRYIEEAFLLQGHGSSTGWESTAETNPQQFTWFNLADDMLSVANYYELPKFIVSGSSMGAATSLWTAIKYPERVAAVIMLRPPTAWDSRAARASVKEGAVRNVLELHPNEMFHKVVAGVSMSDLPPLEDPSVYANITCPVLLLAVSNSKTHPLSSAEKLLELLPNAQLHVCKNEKEASKVWPQVVADFLNTVQSTC